MEEDDQGRTVNRCEGIGWVGSATVTNEDAYLITKTMRTMGLVYIDHQARYDTAPRWPVWPRALVEGQ